MFIKLAIYFLIFAAQLIIQGMTKAFINCLITINHINKGLIAFGIMDKYVAWSSIYVVSGKAIFKLMRITFVIVLLFLLKIGISQPCGSSVFKIVDFHILDNEEMLIINKHSCSRWCNSASHLYEYRVYSPNDTIAGMKAIRKPGDVNFFTTNSFDSFSPESFVAKTYLLNTDTILFYSYYKDDLSRIYYRLFYVKREHNTYLYDNHRDYLAYRIDSKLKLEDFVLDTILPYVNRRFKRNWTRQYIHNFVWVNDSTLSNYNQQFFIREIPGEASSYIESSHINDNINLTLVRDGDTLWNIKLIGKLKIPNNICDIRNRYCESKTSKPVLKDIIGLIIYKYESNYYILIHQIEGNCPGSGIDIIPLLYKINSTGSVEYCRKLK